MPPELDGGDGGGGQLEEEDGGGGEARGRQGLSQEAHIVQGMPAGGGTHVSYRVAAVDSEMEGDVAIDKRRRRPRVCDFAIGERE